MSSRIFKLGGRALVTASAEAGCTIQRGATGRIVSFITQEDKRIDELVFNWFESETEQSFKGHLAASEFECALRSVLIESGALRVYRGRLFNNVSIKNPFEFGPPPADASGHGRYNRAGQPALYLATSAAGVTSELFQHRQEGDHLFCQSFSIDLSEIKVVNLTGNSGLPILPIAFDYSEINRKPKMYFKSQILAEFIKESGFDGLLVPGVRGSNQNRYHNLVIFEPREHWRIWVDQKQTPHLVAE